MLTEGYHYKTGLRSMRSNDIQTKALFFLFVFCMTMSMYLLPEILFAHAMVYLTAGAIGGTLRELYDGASDEMKMPLVIATWILFLLGLVLLCMKLRNRVLRHAVLLLVVIALYVVDAALLVFQLTGGAERFVARWQLDLVPILLKSVLLSLVIYGSKLRTIDVSSTWNDAAQSYVVSGGSQTTDEDHANIIP
jgi:uncharacterized protein with PQ loop repeat